MLSLHLPPLIICFETAVPQRKGREYRKKPLGFGVSNDISVQIYPLPRFKSGMDPRNPCLDHESALFTRVQSRYTVLYGICAHTSRMWLVARGPPWRQSLGSVAVPAAFDPLFGGIVFLFSQNISRPHPTVCSQPLPRPRDVNLQKMNDDHGANDLRMRWDKNLLLVWWSRE